MEVIGIVNILGTDYTISRQTSRENPKLKDNLGLCEQYSKEIIIVDDEELKDEVLCVENLQECMKRVTRHEVIHAFLGESGLRGCSDWAENEEMVDFFAIQMEKIVEAMIKAKCFSTEAILKEAGKRAGCEGHMPVLKPAT